MTTANCPQCGALLPATSPEGLCPKCLLQAGLQSDADSPGAVETTPSPQANRSFVPPTPEELSERFPQLEIFGLIGHGGMGAVYKARQRELDRLVALKILPPEVGSDPAFAERFSREARALARLSHANIVGVYDSGKAGDLYFLTMEFIDGVNLRQAMQAGTISPEEAIAIVPQICDALQYAHDEGIVHRDIKPENVLIDARGRVKIADFGLAKLMASGGRKPRENALTLTQAHQVMGTPRYMAPEQMTGSADVDHRADIYSLGVVFYELLTGEVPMGRFDPPSKRVQVDVRLDEVVLRTLDREPDKRYQRASEIKTAVETISTSKAVSTREAVTVDTSTSETDLAAARSQVKIPAIGLIVVGVLTLLSVPLLVLAAASVWAVTPVSGGDFEVQPPEPTFESYPIEPVPVFPDEAIDESPEGMREEAGGRLEVPADEVVSPIRDQLDRDTAQMLGPFAQAPSRVRTEMESTPTVGWLVVAMILSLILVGLPSLVIGVLIVTGGWKMLSLSSYGLAITASILALVPCQPLFILGWIFGIWSLVVLNREQVKEAFEATARRRSDEREPPSPEKSARRAITGPAIGMIVLGILNTIVALLVAGSAAHEVFTRWGPEPWVLGVMALFIAYTVASIVVTVAGFRLWGFKSQRLVRVAGVLLLVPVTFLSFANIPVGIWTLLVLMRGDVKSLFGQQRETQKPKAATASWADWWRTQPLVARRAARWSLLIVFFICLGMFFSFHMSGQMVFAEGHERESTYNGTIGYPVPWYVVERYPGESTASVKWLSPTLLLIGVAFAAYGAHYRLRVIETHGNTSRWEMPGVAVGVWVALAMLVVVLAQQPLFWP